MSSKDFPDYLRLNKRHWNKLAKRDWEKKAELRKQIRNGAPYIEKMEPKLGPFLRDIKGKKVIVLQFGDGLLMLACARRGALVTGVDFSGEQVRLARKAAAFCGVDVNLVEADCQSLPKVVPSNNFDLAVAECGIFIWIENLDGWMRSAYRVLKNEGRLIVSDFHPLSIVTEEKAGVLTVRKSYFEQQPSALDRGFWGYDEDVPPAVEYLWKLSDIINATIKAGFRLDGVEEFCVEREDKKVPLLPTDFLLVATK
jgi:ubiquinone/menaquinone biosynthesis C-methylase UbiE